MSTNAYIALELPDLRIKYISLHWDGYTEGAGKILLQNWNTTNKINELLNLGSLSELGKEIGVKHPFHECGGNGCKAYGRDRGETGIGPYYAYRTEFDLLKQGYKYLFTLDGEWISTTPNHGFSPLKEQMIESIKASA